MTEATDIQELELDVAAYYNNKGDKASAARARHLPYPVYMNRLLEAEQVLNFKVDRKIVEGKLASNGAVSMKLPPEGDRKFYLLTSIQNNTHLHPGWTNLLAYVTWLNALPNCSCELFVGTYSYQKARYGSKAVKRGKYDPQVAEELWYDPEAEPYIVDRRIALAPGLIWCGEMNILPTAKRPLGGLEEYNGRKSNIIPHAKTEMESVASMADEATKFNYSTGTITQLNYIQKKQGILAEQAHSYGALIVEVDAGGNWWVRQLILGDNDEIMDTGPSPYEGLIVVDGEVQTTRTTESIYWGDGHAAEMEAWVRDLCWGAGGMLDTLLPSSQYIGDIFSMRTRGHHDISNFHTMFAKHIQGEESVEDEIQLTADFANEAHRPWCDTRIVPSNHDRHLERWLNEADFRQDLLNAKYFCWLQYQVLDALERGDVSFNVLEWALRQAGAPEEFDFLSLDESSIVLDIENGLHGDLGSNGARGSTLNLMRLGRRINKGHDHTAAIRGKVYSAGACSLKFPFMRGPNSHSVTHIVTYKNSARTLVTMWGGKWRA